MLYALFISKIWNPCRVLNPVSCGLYISSMKENSPRTRSWRHRGRGNRISSSAEVRFRWGEVKILLPITRKDWKNTEISAITAVIYACTEQLCFVRTRKGVSTYMEMFLDKCVLRTHTNRSPMVKTLRLWIPKLTNGPWTTKLKLYQHQKKEQQQWL